MEWNFHDTGLATDAKNTGNRKKVDKFVYIKSKNLCVSKNC